MGLVVPSKDDLIIANGSKLIRLFRNKPNEDQALAQYPHLAEPSE